MITLRNIPALDRLDSVSTVVIAGAGGGYDILCGLPLYFHLRDAGKTVALANFTFSNLDGFQGTRPTQTVARITADCPLPTSGFPELLLSQWFAARGIEQPVFCIQKTGVEPMVEAYQAIVDLTEADAFVLADGGSDSLLIGNEPDLGTPTEDAISLVAASELNLPVKLLVGLGFGTDARHGVCHAHVLDTIAALTKRGAFLGAISLTTDMPPVQLYFDATQSVCAASGKPSYVNSAILAALQGDFGYVDPPTPARSDPPAWINPLLLLYWFFDLESVVGRLLYAEHIRNTQTALEVTRIIEGFRKGIQIRDREDIPI